MCVCVWWGGGTDSLPCVKFPPKHIFLFCTKTTFRPNDVTLSDVKIGFCLIQNLNNNHFEVCGLILLVFFSASLGNMVKVLRGHQNWVYSSAFSPDSSILCSVGAGKAVSKDVPSSPLSGRRLIVCAFACDELRSISVVIEIARHALCLLILTLKAKLHCAITRISYPIAEILFLFCVKKWLFGFCSLHVNFFFFHCLP